MLVSTCGSFWTDSGTIDVRELRSALQALGHYPSEEELYVMMGMVLPVTYMMLAFVLELFILDTVLICRPTKIEAVK